MKIRTAVLLALLTIGAVPLVIWAALPDLIIPPLIRREYGTLIWISVSGYLLLSTLVGLLLGHRISRGIRRVHERSILEDRNSTGGVDSGFTELKELHGALLEAWRDIGHIKKGLEQFQKEILAQAQKGQDDIKRVELHLLQAQKMAAIGQLSAGIAKEINTPLGNILGYVQVLLMSKEENDPDWVTLKRVEQSTKRCKAMMENLIRFSQRTDDKSHQPIDVNKAIDSALELSKVQLRQNEIHTTWTPNHNMGLVNGNLMALTHVLFNLISNARGAMPGGGTLTIKGETRDDGKVAISVMDTGRGISKENINNIFKDFYTTRDEQNNIGLGLSMAQRLVKAHKGELMVQSAIGAGTTFTILLPALKLKK